MSVIQPMYLYSGKYSAGTVRKFVSAPIQSDSAGLRIEGVVPSSRILYSMKVVPDSGMDLSVKTGLCLISDWVSQTLQGAQVDQPGMYVAGVVDADYAVTIAENSTGDVRYDLVYAEVTENYFTVITKTLGNTTGSASATNTARLTTSSTHGFVEGQTVIVTGVDETFDGQHVITNVPTTTTFEYAKTASDVVSVAVKPNMQIGSSILQITDKEFSNSTGIATITTATSHGLSTASNLNDLITIRGVDTLFDGSHHVLTAVDATNTITFRINRVPIPADVSSTDITSSNNYLANAAVPFAVKVLTGTTDDDPQVPTYTNSIPLARVTVADGASSISAGNISDRRVFTTTMGGVHLYDSTNTAIPESTFGEGSIRYKDNTSGTTGVLEYFDGTNWQIFSSLTLSGTGSASTAAKSDHLHTSSVFTDYLGSSQVQQDDDAGIGFVFGNQSFSATLLANKTYIFEAYIPFSATINTFSQLVGLKIEGSDDGFSSINFDFITWNQTESSSIIRSGYRSSGLTTFLSENITPSLSSGSTYDYFVEVRGVIRTFTSATDVYMLLSSALSDITIGRGAWVRYTNVGDVNQTVINGTWS
jgi:hypothetical protein